MGCSSVVMFVTQEYFGNGTSLHFIFYQVTEYWVLVAAMVFICMSSSLAIQHANCVCVCVCVCVCARVHVRVREILLLHKLCTKDTAVIRKGLRVFGCTAM